MGVVETLGPMSSEELAAFGLIEAVLADFFFRSGWSAGFSQCFWN